MLVSTPLPSKLGTAQTQQSRRVPTFVTIAIPIKTKCVSTAAAIVNPITNQILPEIVYTKVARIILNVSKVKTLTDTAHLVRVFVILDITKIIIMVKNALRNWTIVHKTLIAGLLIQIVFAHLVPVFAILVITKMCMVNASSQYRQPLFGPGFGYSSCFRL